MIPHGIANPSARRLAVLALLVVAIALVACAEVDRTVTERGTTTEDGRAVEVVAWESDRYPPHTMTDVIADECWQAAEVGGPVPDACLTANELSTEADPFQQSPLLAYPLAVLVAGGLVLLAWRRIGWQPAVPRTTDGEPLPQHFDVRDAVALMRSSETERRLRGDAEARRRDLEHPVVMGFVLPLPVLVVLTLLVGYGRTFVWTLGVGAGLFFGVGIATALVLLNFWRPPDLQATFSRLWFLWGAIVATFVVSFVALMLRAPLLELHGVDLPL